MDDQTAWETYKGEPLKQIRLATSFVRRDAEVPYDQISKTDPAAYSLKAGVINDVERHLTGVLEGDPSKTFTLTTAEAYKNMQFDILSFVDAARRVGVLSENEKDYLLGGDYDHVRSLATAMAFEGKDISQAVNSLELGTDIQKDTMLKLLAVDQQERKGQESVNGRDAMIPQGQPMNKEAFLQALNGVLQSGGVDPVDVLKAVTAHMDKGRGAA